ncbi:MAG: c-type cytochrome biogenesis protein CcmI [Hyphomicrobiales bacterium]|nr:MAG: c-type cytochrome biogenesis protein CcmI [Hyphomicrobiales bacterium]
MVLFYAVAGALALATALVLVRPLIRPLAGRAGVETRDARDAQIYRDQLDEIERDQSRGTISAGEAQGARAEVSRRLINATGRDVAAKAVGPAPRRHSMIMAATALVGAPALAVTIYLANGMPEQPDLPLAGRSAAVASQTERPSQAEAEAALVPGPAAPLTDELQEYAKLTQQLEAVVKQRPNDANGLEILATAYMRLGRYSEAWHTYERLLGIPGGDAEAARYAAMAEAMVLATGGYVSPEAERVIGAALTRDRTLAVARYYAGLLMAQTGRINEAITIWEQLKADTPADSPSLTFLDGMLAEAKALREGSPGPSAADIEAAGAMSPDDRQAMIEGMVARLEGRLTSEGGEVEEWHRLMNAYVQLDRPDDAARIARLGIAAFGNATEADFLREQALVMGLFNE